MDKNILDVLNKISSVLTELNGRIGNVEPFPETEYCNRMINNIQQEIVKLENK